MSEPTSEPSSEPPSIDFKRGVYEGALQELSRHLRELESLDVFLQQQTNAD